MLVNSAELRHARLLTMTCIPTVVAKTVFPQQKATHYNISEDRGALIGSLKLMLTYLVLFHQSWEVMQPSKAAVFLVKKYESGRKLNGSSSSTQTHRMRTVLFFLTVKLHPIGVCR